MSRIEQLQLVRRLKGGLWCNLGDGWLPVCGDPSLTFMLELGLLQRVLPELRVEDWR